jgi:putative transposase
LFSFPKTIDSAVGTEKEGKKSKKAKNWKKKSTKKEPAGKSIMIRLYPNKSQKEELNKWFGTARWTYNQVVASLRASPRDVSQYAVVKELRKDFVNNKNSNKEENFADKPWVTKTPYQIRDAALNDVVKAYTSNLAKENNNNFIIHFKKKKAPSDSIAIYANNYKSKGVIFPRFFGKKPIKNAEELPDKLEYDARLVRKRLGHFYLCIPKKLDKYNGPSQNKVIAFDPGMRTFCTGYDPDGIIVEIGKSDISRIYRLCNSYDKLQRKWSQPEVKHRKRYSYKKAGARIQFRIRNLVDEFHKKTTKWVCENYNTIFLPKFETQKMVSKRQRKINSKTARKMLTWSHYRFKTRLMNKAREYPNCRVIICGEEYTSQTCSECGYLHRKIGGSKKFKCPGCNQESDRDFNAARNILLKNMSLVFRD